ncbi:HD domain-containing protein [Terrarubrum flagellatum]|uniref:HD domain-containing protein n=1 Tax=Terrirubrum flagellatum TaxID=2895980 RepID=UPI0031452727
MTATIEDALMLAADKHRGQTDKAGLPYILHPLRVMHHLGLDATMQERMAALLHDLVEDTDVTLDDLRAQGFPAEVVQAVDSLTKRPEEKEDYFAAVRRAGADPIGRKVKIADLTDNMDVRRIRSPTDKDRLRIERYRKALDLLRS